MRQLAYLATPYSKFKDGRSRAFILACEKAAELMEHFNVFSPIAHSHAIECVGTNKIETGDWWLEQDFAILKHCDLLLVYMMPGWKDSYGVNKEIEFAEANKIKIEYIEYVEPRTNRKITTT